MIHLFSGLPLLVEAGLAVFCLLDACLHPEAGARWLPRWAWALAILVFPLVGSIAWLVAGRTWRLGHRRRPSSQTPPQMPPRTAPQTPAGPSADAGTEPPALAHDTALTGELWAIHEEHERTLLRWEEDLRRREEALRRGEHPRPS